MKKILTLTLALLSAAVFACQYPEIFTPQNGYMRYIYISGVNDTDNHIASVTETSRTWNWEQTDADGTVTTGVGTTAYLNFTCKNNITVDLPLTVYVAATPRTSYGSIYDYSGLKKMKTPDDARLVLHLQYRVLPSTTWITAKTVRLDNWQVSSMSTTGKALFGSYTINPTASYGSTIMIRIYITAEPGESLYPGQSGEIGTCPTENADPTSMIAESFPNSIDCKVAVGEDTGYRGYLSNALNLIGISSAFLLPDTFQAEIEETGWTYEQVMTVVVSGKRRPGK